MKGILCLQWVHAAWVIVGTICRSFLRITAMRGVKQYTRGLQSGPITMLVLAILFLFGARLLQKGKPSEEAKNLQIPAGVTEPNSMDPQTGSEEPKATVQSASGESSDPFPDRVAADCSESTSSLKQTGLNEPDQFGHNPMANSDTSPADRQEPLALSSIESEDEIPELQQEAPQKSDEAESRGHFDPGGSC